MRALAGTLGIEPGFVAALAAGADAIETGAGEYPELVQRIPTAAQRAVDEGTLDLQRLREAARRTAALAVVRPPERVDVPTGGQLEQIAARCIEVVGELPALRRPLVVEAHPPPGVASGELPWSLGEVLAQRVPGTETIRATGPLDVPPRRDVVVVVRDPQRHEWQRVLVAAADVLVDAGWPAELPEGVPAIRTRGVAPGLLAAAADALARS
jgi:beta-N-acetylhexosaminidase